jgi:hypothetical protein
MQSQTWRLIAAEAGIAAGQIGYGATALARTSPHEAWSFPHAFFPLSIGFERAAKLALQVDAKLANGVLLDKRQMRTLGHRLTVLLDEVQVMVGRRWPAEGELARPADDVHGAIIEILNEFAIGGRYHNLDALAGAVVRDPVAAWWADVVSVVIARNLTAEQVERATRWAAFVDAAVGDITLVRQHHVDGSDVRDVSSLALQGTLNADAVPWTRMYTLQIARWLARVLATLSDDALRERDPDIPYLLEFFSRFDQPDRNLRRLKRWTAP